MGYKQNMDIHLPLTSHYEYREAIHPKLSLITAQSNEYIDKAVWTAPLCNLTSDPFISMSHPEIASVLELAKYYPVDIRYPGKIKTPQKYLPI